jgi:hypothetical protein
LICRTRLTPFAIFTHNEAVEKVSLHHALGERVDQAAVGRRPLRTLHNRDLQMKKACIAASPGMAGET